MPLRINGFRISLAEVRQPNRASRSRGAPTIANLHGGGRSASLFGRDADLFFGDRSNNRIAASGLSSPLLGDRAAPWPNFNGPRGPAPSLPLTELWLVCCNRPWRVAEPTLYLVQICRRRSLSLWLLEKTVSRRHPYGGIKICPSTESNEKFNYFYWPTGKPPFRAPRSRSRRNSRRSQRTQTQPRTRPGRELRPYELPICDFLVRGVGAVPVSCPPVSDMFQ